MFESADLFATKYAENLFKGTSSLEQLLRQAEIDVLGVKLDGTSQHLYAVDIAVHGGGLNYGDKTETATRVAKKLLRIAMCLHGYLPSCEGNIVLASPSISPATRAPIQEFLHDIRTLLHSAGLPYNVTLLANEDFLEGILQPVLDAATDVEDTTELFMRSVKLYKRFFPRVNEKPSEAAKPAKNRRTTSAPTSEDQKIGAYVKSTLPDLLATGIISQEEITLLQTGDYSKRTLGINYPLLRERLEEDEERPNRYWADPVVQIGDDHFFICCEWHERMRSLYDVWLQKLSNK